MAYGQEKTSYSRRLRNNPLSSFGTKLPDHLVHTGRSPRNAALTGMRPMSDSVFLDINLLIYYVSDDLPKKTSEKNSK
jgi:rhamnose utilization protein RhaD (predicted bifunctional aldolase and dehydrogenase)